MKCWWCRRERKCSEYRLNVPGGFGFVPLCKTCSIGLRQKITESR